MKRKCLLAAVLLISAFSSASAQTNWSYGDNGSAGRRAITARPMMVGRNMAAAVADRYSYGRARATATPVRRRAAIIGVIRSACLFAVVTRATGYLRQPWTAMSRCDHLPRLSARDC